MKTKSILSVAALFLFGIILTSCSTSVDIAKRQYGNGYYIHLASKKSVSSPSQSVLKVEKNSDDVQIKSVAEKIVSVTTLNKDVDVIDKAEASLKSRPSSKINSLPVFESVSELNVSEQKFVQANEHYNVSNLANAKKNFMRGDAPAIVLILLCIFLPFIAVGIVDDWGTRFLFSILLTLLFWLPGVIYAFFVCFG